MMNDMFLNFMINNWWY